MSDASPSSGDFARIERFVSDDAFLSRHPELARDLAAAAQLRTLADGGVAGRAGELERSVTGLVEGALVVWLPIQDGSLRPLHVLRPGAWMVSLPLIKGTPRRVTFSASGATRVLYLDQDAVDRVVDAHPVIWRWFTQLAGEHLERTLGVCVGLLAERPLPRIAGRLLSLSSDTVGPNVAIELKQSDLALLSGLSRNTVSRTLGQLEGMGLIARGYRRLRILDRPGLAQVAAGEPRGEAHP